MTWKRKTCTLVLFFCLAISAAAQCPYPWPAKGVENFDYYLNDRTEPKPNGLHYRTYGDGKLYYAGMFENGKPKASSELYYFSEEKAGQITAIHQFTKDISVVNAKTYHLNGKLSATGQYIRQKKEGEWIFYDDQGNIRSKSNFVNDLQHGVTNTFYESGREFKREEFVNGELNGPFVEWYQDGQIRAKGTYKNGQLNGSVQQFYEDGVKSLDGNYVDGLMNGIWMLFLSDGRIEITAKYDMGTKLGEKRENGTFKDEYDSGIPKCCYDYVNGKKDGPFQEWHEVGEWVRRPKEGNDPKGDYHMVEELAKTQLSYEGYYKDGMLDGEIIYYDINGKIIKIETYTNGELVSTGK